MTKVDMFSDNIWDMDKVQYFSTKNVLILKNIRAQLF